MHETIPFTPTINASGGAASGSAIPLPWLRRRKDGETIIHARDRAIAHWDRIRDYLPENLDGHTVLHLGCGGAFIPVQLARRGAEVTVLDDDTGALEHAARKLDEQGLRHRITLYQGTVYSLARWDRQHDVVVFLDLFHHMRYPLLALDAAAHLTKRCLILQSLDIPGHEAEFPPGDLRLDERAALSRPGWPRLAFIENALAGDSDTWWTPNRAGLEAMLRSTGMEIAARPGDDMLLCQPRASAVAERNRLQEELRKAIGADSTVPAEFQPGRTTTATPTAPKVAADPAA